MRAVGLLGLLTLLTPVAASTRKLTAATKAKFFLEDLPLNITVSTPVQLSTSGTTYVQDWQTLTAVFSRPVFPLGSDFSSDVSVNKIPFRLTCNVPGKTRWVTTTIARFDPDISWPADLSCALRWNAALKTYDGAPLKLGSIAINRPLASYSLDMLRQSITSQLAYNLTGGAWDANSGSPGEKLPEVPPDGVVTLFFNSTVNLKMLKAALQLLEGQPSDGSLVEGPSLPFKLGPCMSTWEDAPLVKAGAPIPPPSLDINSTCATVEVGPVLKPDTWYTLRLPAGATYFPLSGRLKRNLTVTFAGVRVFRLPFRAESLSSASFRRLNLWLPHGLSKSNTMSDLARNIRLCALSSNGQTCRALPFNLTLISPARLRLTAPGLKPGATYNITVTADPTVKDGLGMPLLAATAQLRMSYVPYSFNAPRLQSDAAALEAGVDSLSSWPYITRAPPVDAESWPKGYRRNISSYVINPSLDSDVLRLLSFVKDHYYDISSLGPPALIKPVPSALTTPGSGANWTEVALPLGDAKLQVAYSCCIPSPWGPQYDYDKLSQVLLKTSLSVSVVQSGPTLLAWVTDASLGGSVGVAGANVSHYFVPNDKAPPFLAASCKTDISGVCAVQHADVKESVRLVTLVKAPPAAAGSPAAAADPGPRYGLILDSGYSQVTEAVDTYLATMVQDRRVVVPGDRIKITGFVQRKRATGLSLPPDSYALISVLPDWAGTYSVQSTQFVVKVDGSTGTFHAEIDVPASAALVQYSFSVYMRTPADTSPPALPVKLWDWPSIATGYFQASDPRPPTAELKVEVPPWVAPNDTVRLNVTAVSYIGSSVGSSPVTVRWNIAGDPRSATLLTDVNGRATLEVNLAELTDKQRESLYGTLSFDVEWVGPTRDLITKSASVSVTPDPAVVTLGTSFSSPLPGVSFSVSAGIISNTDGSNLQGIPLTLTLKPDPEAQPGYAPTCSVTAGPCITASGVNWWQDPDALPKPNICRFALPCVGRFVVEGCAMVPTDGVTGSGASTVRVCGTVQVGRGADDWVHRPLDTHLAPEIRLDRPGGYVLGEQPTLVLDNAYSKARLLVVWGNNYELRSKSFLTVATGKVVRVTLDPLGNECRGGCNLRVLVDVPRVSTALPGTNQVAVSRLFDPRAPHTLSVSVPISIRPENSLKVGVDVKALADVNDDAELVTVEPGETAQVTASVAVGAAYGPVEVTFYAVDKAFLDLLPYDLPQPELEMVFQLYSYMSVTGQQSYRLAPGSVRAVYDKLMARLSLLDPWLDVDTGVQVVPYGRAAVDIPNDEYLAGFSSDITYMPGMWYPWYHGRDSVQDGGNGEFRPAMRSPPPPPPSGSNNEDKGSDGNPPPTSDKPGTTLLRRVGEFVITPLFTSAPLGPDGKARVNFTAPQNMGTFVIRAFAAAGAVAKYGSGEGKIIVRRSLSLTPSVPRFVRAGDLFEAGVVVTVGSPGSVVAVKVEIMNADESPVEVLGATTKTHTFVAGEDLQQEVRFSFIGGAIGTASIIISAEDGAPGGGKDAVQMDLSVLGQQGDVWVATSFALAAGGSQWQEGLELPEAVAGSGGLTLTSGVGNFPAILALYDNLALTESRRSPDDYRYAPTALLWATLPGVLSYYGQIAVGAQAALIVQAYDDLRILTHWQLGLQSTYPYLWTGWWPNWADVFLNTRAAFLVGSHGAAVQPNELGDGNITNGWLLLQASLLPAWRTAVAAQVVSDAMKSRSLYKTPYSDWHTLSWIRLALGANWAPPGTTNADVKADLSLRRTLGGVRKASRHARVVLSLALQALGTANPDPALVAATVKEVTSAIRTQGRTAYVAVGSGSPYAASLEDQALCLLLLVRSGATHQLLPKLAAYVASPTTRSGGYLYISASYIDQAFATLAISEYDRTRGSSKPNLNLTAAANGLAVLQASFRGDQTGPVSNFTAWEDLPPAAGGAVRSLDFQVTGIGEVSVAASLHFVPALLPTFPTYRGLYLESMLQLVDPVTGRPRGRSLAVVPLGSLVALTVQLTTPDDLGAVTLSVMMPGGLEPLDPNIAQNAGPSCDFSSLFDTYSFTSYLYSRWGWYWPICPSQQTRPSVVTFSYASLTSGTRSVTINAVAASVGTFVVPPVRAWADQQPELMGMTAGGRVGVCDPAECDGATYAPPPPVPKSCPGGCRDAGVCNLLTGFCMCDAGFTGPDCGTVA